MQLIILTCQDDLHADAVIRRLKERQPEFGVVRLNTDNLADNITCCFGWTTTGLPRQQELYVRDSNISVNEPTILWYRKPDRPLPHPSLSDFNARDCSVQELREFLRSLEGFFPDVVWVNDYWQMQRYSIKANQIEIAKTVGLTIPETVITNQKRAVVNLLSRHNEIIVKPLAYNGYATNDRQYGCFTNVLTISDLADLSEVDFEYAPAIYQQRITKAQELRITVIGSEVFACEISTSPGSIENIDWRIDSVEDLPHRIVDIPDILKQRLRSMLKTMGLNYGAFDVICDETGTYYFIEVNPNGQYLWVELLTGCALTDAMVTLICSISKDKRGNRTRKSGSNNLLNLNNQFHFG